MWFLEIYKEYTNNGWNRQTMFFVNISKYFYFVFHLKSKFDLGSGVNKWDPFLLLYREVALNLIIITYIFNVKFEEKIYYEGLILVK